MNTFTLLIWEENPEQVKLYLIPDEESKKHAQYLELAHNKMINCGDWEHNAGLQFLNTALCSDEDGIPDKGFEEHLGVWAKYLVNSDNPIWDTHITRVYKSGFLL